LLVLNPARWPNDRNAVKLLVEIARSVDDPTDFRPFHFDG